MGDFSVSFSSESGFCACGATDAAGVGAAVEVNTGSVEVSTWGDGCGLTPGCETVPSEGLLFGSCNGSRISFGLRSAVAGDGVAAGEDAADAAAFGFAVRCLKVRRAANPIATSAATAHSARIPVAKILDEFRRRRTPLDKFLVRVLSGKR